MGYIKDNSILNNAQLLLEPFISKKIKPNVEPLIQYIQQDKKRDDQNIFIPVIKSIGNTSIEKVLLSEFLEALQKVLIHEY
jgi:3-dehydroquinate synthetase